MVNIVDFLVIGTGTAEYTPSPCGDVSRKNTWSALMKSKSAFTDAVPGNTEKVFKKADIEQLHGTAQSI